MKEVVIIGAGPSGLAAIRSLSKYKDEVKITVYEVSDRVGGVWVNRDPYKNSPMYDNLRANFPKEVIGYPGFPFPADIKESYLPHRMILEYIESFAKHFELYQYIQFRHTVLNVDIISSVKGKERWNVMVRDEETGAITNKKCDAVIVATGHESKMYIPEFDGKQTYTGEIIHSRYYQNPSHYVGKTVVIVGAGFSGLDILVDIHTVAKKIYVSHHDDHITAPLCENAEYVKDIAKINGNDIIFIDGKVVQADIIFLGTGYRYDFSFLSEKCHPVIKEDHVTNIYRMMVDIAHPSLYYIGLNKLGSPIREFCVQADLAAALIAEKIPTPSREEMEKDYQDTYKKNVTDLGLKPKNFHVVSYTQWDYYDAVCKQTGQQQPDSIMAKKLYNRFLGNFYKDFFQFKRGIYKRLDAENFEVVYEPEVFST